MSRPPLTAAPTKKKGSFRSLYSAFKARFSRAKTDGENPSSPKSSVSDRFAYERLIDIDTISKSSVSDAVTADCRDDEIDLMQSVSKTSLHDNSQMSHEPMCTQCAVQEARDAQTQTDADYLLNSLPPFDPLVSERGPFAGKKDGESVQDFRSVPEARDCDAIEVPRKQKSRTREPVIHSDSNALQNSTRSISAATKNYRCAIHDACETQSPLDIQHKKNMQSILEQEIFDAKALLRRANGVSHEYLALEFALGEAESARTEEKVDFTAVKIHIPQDSTVLACEDEHSSVSLFPQRRQADELDEIDLFVEKS